MKPPARCPLCDGAVRGRGEVPGYQLPARFPVFECERCEASFAWPLEVPPGLYESIYEHGAQLRGYEDYPRFAQLVLEVPQPLDALADASQVFWGLREALRELPRGARVLEVGCGLGYLTYALAESGYEAEGIDLSERAVRAARERFGDRFRRGDAAELARDAGKQYDAVVLTELIEHVPDPVGLLAGLVPLLAPGGRLVLTTPNKSCYRPGTVWQTDLPPVHLWWFAEESLRRLAERLGMGLTFVDFTADERTHGRRLRVKWPAGEVFLPPQLDAEGGRLDVEPVRGARAFFPGGRMGAREWLAWARYKLDPGRRVHLTEQGGVAAVVLLRP